MSTVSSTVGAQDELSLDNVLHEVDYSQLLYLHVLISSWAFLLTGIVKYLRIGSFERALTSCRRSKVGRQFHATPVRACYNVGSPCEIEKLWYETVMQIYCIAKLLHHSCEATQVQKDSDAEWSQTLWSKVRQKLEFGGLTMLCRLLWTPWH